MGTDSLKLPYVSQLQLCVEFVVYICFVSLVQLYSATLVQSFVFFVSIL